MIIHKFSNFSICYGAEITPDNYFKTNIKYEGPECCVTLLAYHFYYDLAKQLTSTDEQEVLKGLKEYKYIVNNYLNYIKV